MQKCPIRFGGILLLMCAALAPRETTAQYASSVVSYIPGSDPAPGFNLPATALGEPSRITEHQFGGPVDQYNPAWLNSQVVSVGGGGSLTLQMSAPVVNDASNPFGLDFIIYGNAGFFLTDFNAGKTDGTIFAPVAIGSTRVSVSADNVEYFTLDPNLAPTADSYFPTDGSGLFGQAVNPAFANAATFNGMTLAEIRGVYAGSAGGAGYDLAWARDGGGSPVSIGAVNYIRIEVLTGAVEIDGVSAVPEPTTWGLLALGAASVWLRKRHA